VPELASRQHVRDICGVVEAALAKADASMNDLGAVAVTQGPGLVGSLLVGVAFAKTFAWARGIPVIPVHHLAGHIESLVLAHGELPLPSAVLVVSGGHTSLYLITEPARLTHADRNAPRPTGEGLLPPDVARRADFSFSGLKTAVLRLVRERTGIDQRGRAANADGAGATLPASEIADISASFQRVVVDVLLDRTFEAARWLGARSIGISGGVSANSRLRSEAEARALRAGIPVFVPPLALSTDNAAMIGAAAFRKLARCGAGPWDFNAEAALPL
jgi:N6-L-threonylcarbamoyladenine synthase